MEVDKRTLNGNNGTRRGKDKKKRRPRAHSLGHKPEVLAGMRARTEKVFEFFGGVKELALITKMKYATVYRWKKVGMISPDGAHAIQRHYKKTGGEGFRAMWVRPDLKFDANGKPIYRSAYSMNARYIERRDNRK